MKKTSPLYYGLAGLLVLALAGVAFGYSSGNQLQGRLPSMTSAGGWTKALEVDGQAGSITSGSISDLKDALEQGMDVRMSVSTDEPGVESYDCNYAKVYTNGSVRNFLCYSHGMGLRSTGAYYKEFEEIQFYLQDAANWTEPVINYYVLPLEGAGSTNASDLGTDHTFSVFVRR